MTLGVVSVVFHVVLCIINYDCNDGAVRITFSSVSHAGLNYEWTTRNVPTTARKMKFPLRISSVNLTKFAGNCRFGHIYWRNC